jgi:hypothetical protein
LPNGVAWHRVSVYDVFITNTRVEASIALA